MKINWGTGIVIGMIAFMGFILTLAFTMIGHKVDLVAKDYYEQGIEYETHITQVKEANALETPVQITVNYTSGQLEIVFPQEFKTMPIEGNIYLFRPSNAQKDFSEKIQLDTSLLQHIALAKMARGNWLVKLQWKSRGKEYYVEKEVVI